MDDKNEYVFFDKGLGLAIANLDYAIDTLTESKSKYVDELSVIANDYDSVEDFKEYRELNKKLIKLVNDIEKENKDKSLYVMLNEAIYINKYIEKLLDGSNDEDIDDQEVINYLNDNYESTIKKIIDLKDAKETLPDDMMKVLKILADEHKQEDIDEGLEIVLAFLINTTNEGKDFKEVFSLTIEADSIASFIWALNQED